MSLFPLIEKAPFFVWVNWEEVVPILDDGTGPIEVVGDFAEVWACNKHEAKWAGYREMEHWPKEQKYDDAHPLRGFKAELATCSHGVCLAGQEDPTLACAECVEEWEHVCARVKELEEAQRTLSESEGKVPQ